MSHTSKDLPIDTEQGALATPDVAKQPSVSKSLTRSWREDLDEYGQLHSLGCEVNSEGGADVGTEPADCCENMRMIAGFVQEQIDNENMRWVGLARAHRPYCRPEGSKMLTRAIRNRHATVTDLATKDPDANSSPSNPPQLDTTSNSDATLYNHLYAAWTGDIDKGEFEFRYRELQNLIAQEANKAREKAIIDATGGIAIPNLMNHQKSRNTAFKKYAIKFFNTKIKERRERMLKAMGDFGSALQSKGEL